MLMQPQLLPQQPTNKPCIFKQLWLSSYEKIHYPDQQTAHSNDDPF
jgi:hypothetical protein